MDQEELHNEIQETLQDIDNELTETITKLGKLRDSFEKDDPNYSKVNAWYVKLLTRNPLPDVIDEMDGQEADPDGDDQPAEKQVVLSIPVTQARESMKLLRFVQDDPRMTPDDLDNEAISQFIVELETAVG